MGEKTVLVAQVADSSYEAANGVGKVVAQLCQHLPIAGAGVEVWMLSPESDVVKDSWSGKVPLYRLPAYAVGGQLLPTRAARDFVRRRAQEVDLLHLHSVYRADNLALARLGIPYVVTPHGGYLSHNRPVIKRVWLTVAERRFLRRAAAVHTLCPPETAMLRRIDPAIRAYGIENGVEADLLDLPVAPPSDGNCILYVGRLSILHKGLDLLLAAYATALRSGAALPSLILAGPDFRGGKAALQELANRLGIAERVQFVGAVVGNDHWRLMSSARLCALTSRHEGMPLAVLEAMAVARPVLVTPATNLADSVRSAGAGFVAEGTVPQIADALVAFSRMVPSALDTMGRRGRRLIAREHLWPAIAVRMTGLYRMALRHDALMRRSAPCGSGVLLDGMQEPLVRRDYAAFRLASVSDLDEGDAS